MSTYDQWLTNDPAMDVPEWCEVCATADLDKCICPECPVCGSVGDPLCYEGWEEFVGEEWIWRRPFEGCNALTFSHPVLSLQAYWEWYCAEQARGEALWLAEVKEKLA